MNKITKNIVFGILIVIVGIFFASSFSAFAEKEIGAGLLCLVLGSIFLRIGLKIKRSPIKEEKEEDNLKNISKNRKGPLITLLIFIGVLACIIQNCGKQGTTPQGVFANSVNITTMQAEKALNILKGCGIEKVDSIKHDVSLDNMNKKGEKGYRINSGNVENIILYLDKTGLVNTVRWVDNNLYARNKIIAKITDFTLTIQEMSNIQINCEKTIENIIKSPKTAEFPNINDWGFIKKNGVITVGSYVDAQNSFGAKIRSEFQFKIKNSVVTSLIFEGKEYIK